MKVPGYCREKGIDAFLIKVKSTDDSITLKCEACGEVFTKEIGWLADFFKMSENPSFRWGG